MPYLLIFYREYRFNNMFIDCAESIGSITCSLIFYREYRSNNISVNIYLVNERWLYSLYWCMGVASITTDNCQSLSAVNTPIFHLVSTMSLYTLHTYDISIPHTEEC